MDKSQQQLIIANQETVNQDFEMDERQPVTKKWSYDAALKLKVVEYAENNMNRTAARKHNVDERTVPDWHRW